MSKSRKEKSRDNAADADESTSGESGVIEDSAADETDAAQEDDTAAIDPEARQIDLEAEVADLNDQLLRKQADFENFRKRMLREREEAAKYANEKLLLDLVEVIDNFERAIKSSEESQDFTSFHEGIELIERQFTGMLDTKWGLKRFESEGEEFDPQRHEAIAVDQSGEYEPQQVIDDYQKGYLLHDRVLRPSKVRVAMPAEEAAPNSDTEEETE